MSQKVAGLKVSWGSWCNEAVLGVEASVYVHHTSVVCLAHKLLWKTKRRHRCIGPSKVEAYERRTLTSNIFSCCNFRDKYCIYRLNDLSFPSLSLSSAGFPAECIRTWSPCSSPSIPAGYWGVVRGCGRAGHRGGGHEVSGARAMAGGYGGVVQTYMARAGEILHP